ncbi:hypothetical protein PR202_gb05540 [Eleusine coracana subsp. coracana]|uniref:Ubiquitin-like modifier-activating enzyme ATG7 n=1 Tax=Eleusine coracana subsp. coracana TaxID=191504 RepID=A0AAV5E7J3_ELECO|nr:hypothetical protein PR202_gb05540 [Eleusine coracana subsp. coracana]
MAGPSTESRFPRPLSVLAIKCRAEEGFWDALRRLKLDVLGTDDSPLPITGQLPNIFHSLDIELNRHLSSDLRLCPESLVPPSDNSYGNRNHCPVPGTLINTNNMRGFQNLDREHLLRAEAKKILHDIISGKVEEDPSLLLRFLVISFADLKNWKVHYNVAFPSLVFNTKMTLLSQKFVSQVLSKKEAASLYSSLQKWRSDTETTVVPFFLVSISSDSSASVRQLKDWNACQGNCQKLLFGFYDHGHSKGLSKVPGWAIRNYIAFLNIQWKIEKVHFFCYRENQGKPDLEQSLIGEASFPPPYGWQDPDYVPEAIGWEGEKPGKGSKEIEPKEIILESMNPVSRDNEQQLMHLKLMGWRHFPVNIEKLSHIRVLLLGAGTLGCEVARLLITWGVRKLTVVDHGYVATSDLVKQSLYIDKDCGVPRATAIIPHLKERCPAVEVEGIKMEIPMPGHPVSPSKIESIAITAVLGYDNYVVMRHGAGTGDMDEGTDWMDDLSTKDALGRQRLGCCFCNDSANLSVTDGKLDQHATTLPGLTSIASGKAVELFARMLHHPDEIYAPGDIAGMDSEHQLGILPHQLRGSLPNCVLSTELVNCNSNCTACSSTVLSEYRKRGLDFVTQAINYPTYLKDLTGIIDLKRPNACSKIPISISVNSDKFSDVRCLLLGAGTLGCDVARILMDCGVRKLTMVDCGHVVVSNLARQSLYTSDDRGAPKVTAILSHLSEKCPSVDAQGIQMEIPMPGHPVSPNEATAVLEDCKRLKELVASHDAIFLLTDTRESRWLPTLLCADENKIAITAALGYDSYLVMRHGAGPGINCKVGLESNTGSTMYSNTTWTGLYCIWTSCRPLYKNVNPSRWVLSEYRRRDMGFVMQVINEPTYLEDLTGLTDLMKSAACSQVEWVDESDDEFVEL